MKGLFILFILFLLFPSNSRISVQGLLQDIDSVRLSCRGKLFYSRLVTNTYRREGDERSNVIQEAALPDLPTLVYARSPT